MPIDPTAQAHIHKALRFEQTRASGLAELDWNAVMVYYAGLHWVTAAVIALHAQRGRPRPDTSLHVKRKAAMRAAGIPRRIGNAYLDLENISRRARYEVAASQVITPSDLHRAVRLHAELRAWATGILTADGYTCT